MLDEPTNGLDPTGMREMRLLLRRLADDGTTIFVSSHLLSEVEAMCDRVGVMAQGRLVAEGPPGDAPRRAPTACGSRSTTSRARARSRPRGSPGVTDRRTPRRTGPGVAARHVRPTARRPPT